MLGCAESSSLHGIFSGVQMGATVVVCGLFVAVASLVVEPGLQGVRAQRPCGMSDIPGSGIESLSPALAGGFFTTEPPGSP